MTKRISIFLLGITFLFAIPSYSESENESATSDEQQSDRGVAGGNQTSEGIESPVEVGNDVLFLDFENPDVYIDESEAIRSKQYVRRAILSSVIESTSKFTFSRFYINHLMGFSAVLQKTSFAKYTSGMQGLSVGYVTDDGHAFEAGLEVSAISNVFAGYRYFFRPERFSLWPFAGIGGGKEMRIVAFADGPPESKTYDGQSKFGFFCLGVMVPLVDVALKAEFRMQFYDMDRLVLTQGLGVVIFL